MGSAASTGQLMPPTSSTGGKRNSYLVQSNGDSSGRMISGLTSDMDDKERSILIEKTISKESKGSNAKAFVDMNIVESITDSHIEDQLYCDPRISILPKGGHWFQVGKRAFQIGCPPETIKDTMTLGLEVPRYFVVVGEMFSRKKGINFTELEFPAYFNHFIRKQKIVVITTERTRRRIVQLFTETLLGPENPDVSLDYRPGTSPGERCHFTPVRRW